MTDTERNPSPAGRRPVVYLWTGLAILTCPCHIPIVAAILAGTAAGAFLGKHWGIAAFVMTGFFVLSVAGALRAFTHTGRAKFVANAAIRVIRAIENDLVKAKQFLGERCRLLWISWEYIGADVLGDHGQFGGHLTALAISNEPLAATNGADPALQRLRCRTRGGDLVDPSRQFLGAACQTLDECNQLFPGCRCHTLAQRLRRRIGA